MMDGNMKQIVYGYLLMSLIGYMLPSSFASANNKQTVMPESVNWGPGPVILVSPLKGDDGKGCGTISSNDCLKKLQTFLRLTSLPFTSDKAELDKLCSNAIGGYNCSAQKISTPNCLKPEDKDLFPVFVNMAEYTFFMFCTSGPDSQAYLRDALLQNSECILKQKKDLDCCAEQSKLPDLPIMNMLDQSGKSVVEREIASCCPVANYIKCAQTIVSDKCGVVAGNLTIEYIRRSSGEQMESVCQKMQNYPEPDPDVCKAPAPVCAGSRIGTFTEMIVLMSLLFVTWLNYI